MHATDLQRDKVSRLVTWGHWFAFINGLLAAIIAVRYVKLLGWPDTLLSQLYTAVTLLGHFSFVSFLIYLLLLFPISLILPYSKILRGYAAIMATLGHMLLVYDTLVFDHYRLHLNPFVFDISFADLPKLISNPWLLVAPAAMLALQLLLANGLWKRIERLSRRQWGGKIASVMIGLFLGSHLLHIWADANVYQPIVQQDEMLPLHYPATARSFMASRGIVDEETLLERETSALPTKQLTYPTRAMQCIDTPSQPLLMVTIDALRRDMVTPETMPFLSQWSKTTHHFMAHYSGSNEAGQGLRSLLYGLLPAYEGSLLADQKAPVLTQQLTAKGYALTALGVAGSQLEPATQLVFRDFELIQERPFESAAQRDTQTTDQALHLLSSPRDKLALLVQYHAPSVYSTPVGFVGLPTVKPQMALNEAQAVLFNQYRSSLTFLDGQLERLLDAVSPDTLVVITGNNGQEFTSLDNRLSRNFSDATTGVPLMIRWPGDAGKRIGYPTSHYAVAPTLLTNLLGCTNSPAEYSVGDTLYAPSTLEFLVTGNRRYVAIMSKGTTTVIDNHGDYRVYDRDNRRIRNAKLDAPTLLQVMAENRRLFAN
ncbi:DUF3413 domain-containing protein [Ferrimonas sediminicola]|uniref:DUF3413 domain-containing protein n=1 Tax=Ferrimonas sediminicola TaxID=2569538 RepID=A0A4U1BEM8_9GAMM|nr:DUF3413 domain-containing protein [Ferrimonas sediminicola]TKB48450.1 DUF3413 domain-containing protein [Ferrimonas sediminicola]